MKVGMWKGSSNMCMPHKKGRKYAQKIDIWLHQIRMWEQKQSSPEKKVLVSMATTKEQPRLSECGQGVLAPLLLPEKSTQTDENGQSIWADSWTRWRRMSPPLQQRLKKSSGTIKHYVQWQCTKGNAWKQLLVLQQRSICSINKFIQTEGQQVFIKNEFEEVGCKSLFFWFGRSVELTESFACAASAAGSVDIGIWSKHLLQRWQSTPW